ncbi:MAG TPA: response regulator [Coleofasciculaceae cyanobacterium]|jgi:CheY-like chemotaxis protein
MTKILVIEDEETVRENILELLDAEGFDAIAAENGRLGLFRAQQYLPDLILCDIRMPELDGYGVLTALRSEPTTAAIPFIFLSAKAAKTDLSLGMELGAKAYITKPFTLTELLDTIEQALLPSSSSFA